MVNCAGLRFQCPSDYESSNLSPRTCLFFDDRITIVVEGSRIELAIPIRIE